VRPQSPRFHYIAQGLDVYRDVRREKRIVRDLLLHQQWSHGANIMLCAESKFPNSAVRVQA
jgi:hypothetical protein